MKKEEVTQSEIMNLIERLTLEQNGVNSFYTGLTENLAKSILGRDKVFQRGIKITEKNNQIAVDLNLIVDYGTKIPNLAWDLQQIIKEELFIQLGVVVREINIHIQGVS